MSLSQLYSSLTAGSSTLSKQHNTPCFLGLPGDVSKEGAINLPQTNFTTNHCCKHGCHAINDGRGEREEGLIYLCHCCVREKEKERCLVTAIGFIASSRVVEPVRFVSIH